MSKPKTQKQVVEYQEKKEEKPEVVDYERPPLPQYPNLHTVVGKVITIKDVEYRDTRRGRVYYVHCDEGDYYTWSQVVGKQLEQIINDYLSKGIKVRAKVVRVKNYLQLASPKE